MNAAAHAEDPVDPVRALAEERLQDLTSRLDPSATLFLLVDPLLGDPVVSSAAPADPTRKALDDWRAGEWGRPVHSLSLPRRVELQAEVAPYLVELAGPADEWLSASIEWAIAETLESWGGGLQTTAGTSHRMGAWIEAQCPGDDVSDQLSAWLELRAAVPSAGHYLRLGDRRVWGLCQFVLGTEAVSRRLERIGGWHWLDHHTAWQSLIRPADLPPDGPARSGVFHAFTPAQWATMADGPLLHMALAAVQGQRWLDHWEHGTPLPVTAPVSPTQWRAATSALEFVKTLNQDAGWSLRLPSPQALATACALQLLAPGWADEVQKIPGRFEGPIQEWGADLYAVMTSTSHSKESR